jgi:polyisoprenoid-binding protein YceI
MAGSIAAVVAALVSLPLHAPDDAFFNTATVVLATLLLGLLAGAAWSATFVGKDRPLRFVAALVAGFLAVVAVAVGGETFLDRSVSFVVPLAAVAFLITGVLTAMASRLAVLPPWWLTSTAAAFALAIGVGLAGQGDAESGRLSLPPRGEVSKAVPSTPNPSPAAGRVTPATPQPPPAARQAAAPTPQRSAPTATATPTVSPAADIPEGRTYVVVDGSEATFTVGEQLVRLPLPNDAVMRTTALSGWASIDLRRSVVEIDLQKLSSDQPFRDNYVRSRMFRTAPIATFTVDDLGDVAEGFLERFFAGETVTGQVTGSLSIRNVVVPLTFDVEARNDGDVVHVLGRTTFT